jgi:hypothetical protein
LRGVAAVKQGACLFRLDHFRNAADVGPNDRLAETVSLQNPKGRVFVPLGRHDHCARLADGLPECCPRFVSEERDVCRPLLRLLPQLIFLGPCAHDPQRHLRAGRRLYQRSNTLLGGQSAEKQEGFAGLKSRLETGGVNVVGNMDKPLASPPPFNKLLNEKSAGGHELVNVTAIAVEQAMYDGFDGDERTQREGRLQAALQNYIVQPVCFAGLAHSVSGRHRPGRTQQFDVVQCQENRDATGFCRPQHGRRQVVVNVVGMRDIGSLATNQCRYFVCGFPRINSLRRVRQYTRRAILARIFDLVDKMRRRARGQVGRVFHAERRDSPAPLFEQLRLIQVDGLSTTAAVVIIVDVEKGRHSETGCHRQGLPGDPLDDALSNPVGAVDIGPGPL